MEIAQDLLDAVLVLNRFVEPELEFRSAPQAQPSGDLPPEKRGRAVERPRRFLPRFRIAEAGVEDARNLQVGRDLHARQRDEADARVVHFTAGETTARLLRDNVVVHEGKIGSLRRFKDDVSEVKSGFECGIGLERYNDIKVGDLIEVFTMERVKATA